MTNQTDTERVISILSDPMSQIEQLENGGIGMVDDSLIRACDLAITALRSQSEAERKVEKVRAECEMRIEFHHRMDCSQAKISDQAYYRVLEVLNREGKADERE